MKQKRALDIVARPTARPLYELRVTRVGPATQRLEVWQLPSPSTPNLREPLRVAGLQGRNLELVEHRVLRRLGAAHVSLPGPLAGPEVRQPIEEDLALPLGLLFRVLAPMKNRDAMRACAEGIDAMAREEASYWLGMAMHRRNPRRVLAALRWLLTDPHRPQNVTS